MLIYGGNQESFYLKLNSSINHVPLCNNLPNIKICEQGKIVDVFQCAISIK